MDSILKWNEVALESTRLDFSRDGLPPEQPGPTWTSRALAIVHLAMYDAWIGVMGGGPTYLAYENAPAPSGRKAEARAAVATAAALTLMSLYTRDTARIQAEHAAWLVSLQAGPAVVRPGVAWGRRVAHAMLDHREDDGSHGADAPYAPGQEPGDHRPDPVNLGQGFLGSRWGRVRPFLFRDVVASHPGKDHPALDSTEYAAAFADVVERGTEGPLAQHLRGVFWAYDGARGIGVPPRLYNQAVRAIVATKGDVLEETHAKLFALVNAGMADAGIQAWAEKYTYNLWRPVVGVREADKGNTGPTGAGDGNPHTLGQLGWRPFGAPRTNQPGAAAFTPNFPAYPSGHATFGTVAFELVKHVLGVSDTFAFELVSDELDGRAVHADGTTRPYRPESLTIRRAIDDNLESRVDLGVHWIFDGTEGRDNGVAMAAAMVAAFPARVPAP